MQLLTRQEVEAQEVRADGCVRDAFDDFHLTCEDVDLLVQLGASRIRDIDQLQAAAVRGHGGDFKVRVHGDVGRVAREGELAENDGLLELRGVDDGKTIGTRCDVGGLTLRIERRSLDDDFLCLPL